MTTDKHKERHMRHWLTPAEYATYRWLWYCIIFNWAAQCREAMEELADARRDAYILARMNEGGCYTGADSLPDYAKLAVYRTKYRALRVKQRRHWVKERSLEMVNLRHRILALRLTGQVSECLGEPL